MVLMTAILAITPKYIATQVEQDLTFIVDSINQQGAYKAEIIKFEDKWFTSNAQLRVGIEFPSDLNAQPEVQYFPLEFNATHGLILTKGESLFGLLHWQLDYQGTDLRDSLSWDENSPLCSISATHLINGDASYFDQCNKFTALNNENDLEATFAGYQGKGLVEAQQFSYSGTSEGFSIESQLMDINTAEFTITMSMEGSLIDAMLGKIFDSIVAIDMSNITANDPETQQQFIANGLRIAATTKVDNTDNTTDFQIIYQLDNVDAAGFVASDFKIAVEANDFLVVFIEKLTDFANKAETMEDAEVQAAVESLIENDLLEALMMSPELNVSDFHGTLPQGKFSFNMFNKIVGVDALPEPLEDQTYWLQHVNSNAQLNVDKDVLEFFAGLYVEKQMQQTPQIVESMTPEQISNYAAEQTPAMLDSLTQQGLITLENEKYSTTFTLKGGEADINGTPFPIGATQ